MPHENDAITTRADPPPAPEPSLARQRGNKRVVLVREAISSDANDGKVGVGIAFMRELRPQEGAEHADFEFVVRQLDPTGPAGKSKKVSSRLE
jgi:hypothetical protein